MPMDPHEDCSEHPWLENRDLYVDGQRDDTVEMAKLEIQNDRLKETILNMRQALHCPNNDELALLTVEKNQLEERVRYLESNKEQLTNTIDHLSKVVKAYNTARVTSHGEFTQLVQGRIKQCTDVLFIKNKEYSSEGDRLHNFKVAGQFLGQHPVTALKGMMVKHEVSIFDIMVAVIKGKQPPSSTTMNDKFNDIHNYYFLLEALIEEYRDKS